MFGSPQFGFEPRAMQVRDCTLFQGAWPHGYLEAYFPRVFG
jgi:hypothetical protein